MENFYLPEINQRGHKHVENWLNENGYSDICEEMLKPNVYGYFAKGRIENVIIQITTFLHPQRPFKLSDLEIEILTAKAVKLGTVAYAAYVTVDDKNALVGEIIWDRLS